ncbi:MAG: 4Fe-4S binding protein [Pirellulales bacterium]
MGFIVGSLAGPPASGRGLRPAPAGFGRFGGGNNSNAVRRFRTHWNLSLTAPGADQTTIAKAGPRKKLPKELPVINADNCTGCESCLEVCPVDGTSASIFKLMSGS